MNSRFSPSNEESNRKSFQLFNAMYDNGTLINIDQYLISDLFWIFDFNQLRKHTEMFSNDDICRLYKYLLRSCVEPMRPKVETDCLHLAEEEIASHRKLVCSVRTQHGSESWQIFLSLQFIHKSCCFLRWIQFRIFEMNRQ